MRAPLQHLRRSRWKAQLMASDVHVYSPSVRAGVSADSLKSPEILTGWKELYLSFFQTAWSPQVDLRSRYGFASVGRWVVLRTQHGCDSVINISLAPLSAVK